MSDDRASVMLKWAASAEQREALDELVAAVADSMERQALEDAGRREMSLDMKRIANLVNGVDELLETFRKMDADDETNERRILWQGMTRQLAEATEMARQARVRDPGQVLVRRLVLEHCERMNDMMKQVKL